ncbi:sulfatase [Streptomyces sp. NPDC050704]|uniref:sulfatase family protein n=1 Tax=Streptomyces sp. NPDC050704 TaxID=3157219 RepID=UPI00342E916B
MRGALIRKRLRNAAVVGLALVLTAAGVTAAAVIADEGSPDAERPAAERPNIVYIQVDDMSADLLSYMTEAAQLRQQGTTMANYVFADSLCCSSRASGLTGRMPHNTGVLTNTSQFGDGGLGAFLDDEDRTYATALRKSGYRTGKMGKYLNEYRPEGADPAWDYDYPADYVPPGWNEWHVAGKGGYGQMNYPMTEAVDGNKKRRHYQDTYLTDLLSGKAVAFLNRSVNDHADQPFFLEVSPFAPHSAVARNAKLPFVPAPRDRANPDAGFAGDCGPVDCNDVKAPRDGSFDRTVADGPQWLRESALTADEKTAIDRNHRLRVQMMQSLNDMIKRLRAHLTKLGVADNTYVVFGSDNGFHLGEHRLLQGKGTPYDHDARVPILVAGPEVKAGATRRELVQNTDMYATFLSLAGLTPGASDGRSMAQLWRGETDGWARDAAFLEHTSHAATTSRDPDAVAGPGNAQPGSYKAIRTADELYVEYATGEVEYHDLAADPHQLTNTAAELPEDRRAVLHRTLTALSTCGRPDKPDCWTAGQIG